MIRFQRAHSLEAIHDSRQAYFDGLPQPQELFLEMRIQRAQGVQIGLGERVVGYFIHDGRGTLLEFFLMPSCLTFADGVFGALLDRHAVKKALCKSFDKDLMACCLDRGIGVEVLGFLFRDHHEPSGRMDAPWTEVRPAARKDAARIKAIRHGLFDSDEEVEDCLARGIVQVYYSGEALLGCGLSQPVIHGRSDMDVGMLVHPAHRGKGVGTAILRHLVDQVLTQGGRPIAGCAADNLASRRTLERAGFTSRHRLLSFQFATESS